MLVVVGSGFIVAPANSKEETKSQRQAGQRSVSWGECKGWQEDEAKHSHSPVFSDVILESSQGQERNTENTTNVPKETKVSKKKLF